MVLPAVDAQVFFPRRTLAHDPRRLVMPTAHAPSLAKVLRALSFLARRVAGVSLVTYGPPPRRRVPVPHTHLACLSPPERAQLYSDCGLFVYLDPHDRQPVYEAMACGAPVIAVSGGEPFLRHGENCWLVSPLLGLNELVRALHRVLSDSALQNRLSEGAHGTFGVARLFARWEPPD